MARIDDDDESLDLPRNREQDGVASLHDAEAEAGDEEEVDDDYDLDLREARELGVRLDDSDEQEPRLN